MKKGKVLGKVLFMAAISGMLFAGCGSSGSNSAPAMAKEEIAQEAAADTAAGGAMDGGNFFDASAAEAGETEAEETGADIIGENAVNRKLIRNVNLEVETETFDQLLGAVGSQTADMGGYIEESYTYNGSIYYGNNRKSADLTIRIPSSRLDEFLSSVSEISNVISRNESVTDVTLQYVDMESRKKALIAEHERLLELLSKAENVEDIISIESRLSEVRYQMESMEAQLRALDNQVSYSTVYLHINEVTKLTPVKEQSAGEKIAAGFLGSLSNIGQGIVDFGIGFVINLPYLLLAGAAFLAVFFGGRVILKKRRKGKEEDADNNADKNIEKNADKNKTK